MYESLRGNCDSFHLYVFAFDDRCYEILGGLALEKVTVISLKEFESSELLALKPMRTRAEYCWTCTPSIIRYSIDQFELDHCTYLDADLYFWNSPKYLLEEMGENSILITEHRYPPRYDQSKKSGKYCVQFMTFRDDERGNKALNWWRDACNVWCYDRFEGGKFGDQKYLDDWTERFEGVHVLRHMGGGVAPWNIQQFDIVERRDKLFGRVKNSEIEFELIFYHFHQLHFFINGQIDLGSYKLSEHVKKFIYRPYIKHLEKIQTELPEIEQFISMHGASRLNLNCKILLRHIKRKLLSNILNKNEFLVAE